MTTAVIHHDRRYVSASGVSPVKIKVTFKVKKNGKNLWIRKFYGEGFYCTSREYSHFFKPGSEDARDMMNQVMALRNKAQGIIERRPNITLALFESEFFGIATDTLTGMFEKRIAYLKAADRIGTARTCRTALNTFKRFTMRAEIAKETDKDIIADIINRCELRFSEVTAIWLADYQAWMVKKSLSVNTVGIHLRTLRAVFNEAISTRVMPADFYPFRSFKIRSESKFKIPLSENEIQALKDYAPKEEDRAEARDYFLFSYFCNGMNLVDVCRLRHSDITDEFLIYDRSKTRATKINFKKIIIPIDHETAAIIKRRGRSLDPGGYIFPILEEDLSALTIKSRVQNFIRKINQGLRGVATDLKIKKKLTTVIARHTFANRMSNSGAPRRMIQEQLGHQTSETTEHYLGTMDVEKIKKAREAL